MTTYVKDNLVELAKANMPDDIKPTVVEDLEAGTKFTSFTPHADIGDAEVEGNGTQELTFFIDTSTADTKFEVGNTLVTADAKPYDPNRIDRALPLGKAQEWTLQSHFVSHPFHIHVNPFQIVSITDPNGKDVSAAGAIDDAGGEPYDPQYPGLKGVWKDTLWIKSLIPQSLPAGFSGIYTVKVRTRYQRYIGEFVLHCHILDHEDQGMMQNVAVVLPDQAADITQSKAMLMGGHDEPPVKRLRHRTAPFTWNDVEAILAAAGGSAGPGSLTGLTLPEFLALKFYGMPLIAPVSASCCGNGDAKGRGARSALIRGLRGLPPFDGTQFARLPWGGTPVADADIDRIETWIDEGCAGALIGSTALAGEVSVATEARIEVKGLAGTVFGAASDPAAWRYAKGELRQRMDVDVLDDAQKARLRHAFRELYRLNKWVGDKRSYNNLALIHQNHCQHGWERFLPWHRVYLYEFEQALQDFCPDVTMPWWDFPAERYKPDDPGSGAILPDAFKGFLTEASIGFLARSRLPGKGRDAGRQAVVQSDRDL